ncbi:hypothetical protein FRC08_003180 [Ceratobasidium sp. 394]|nr:hypothetical protein FRC08_003180 [Ceratobasidium sp. 394]
MRTKSGQAPVTKRNATAQQPGVPQQQQSGQSQRDASFSLQQRDMRSPGSSNFPYSPGFPRSPGFAPQLQNQSFAETTSVTRPQPVHRCTMSSTQYPGSPMAPVPSDPLTASSHSRHPYASPATPEVGPGVHVTIQTTVRRDGSCFSRPSGAETVILGDEELPDHIGDGLSDTKRPSNEDEEERLQPHPNQQYRTGSDCFSASGPSVIWMGSVNGSQVPLTRSVSLRGRARGLHPLLVHYTSPIDLHVKDDARIGRAL